jgi:hypothetical protein
MRIESDRERIAENGEIRPVSVSVNETHTVGAAAVTAVAAARTASGTGVSCFVSGSDCDSPDESSYFKKK